MGDPHAIVIAEEPRHHARGVAAARVEAAIGPAKGDAVTFDYDVVAGITSVSALTARHRTSLTRMARPVPPAPASVVGVGRADVGRPALFDAAQKSVLAILLTLDLRPNGVDHRPPLSDVSAPA